MVKKAMGSQTANTDSRKTLSTSPEHAERSPKKAYDEQFEAAVLDILKAGSAKRADLAGSTKELAARRNLISFDSTYRSAMKALMADHPEIRQIGSKATAHYVLDLALVVSAEQQPCQPLLDSTEEPSDTTLRLLEAGSNLETADFQDEGEIAPEPIVSASYGVEPPGPDDEEEDLLLVDLDEDEEFPEEPDEYPVDEEGLNQDDSEEVDFEPIQPHRAVKAESKKVARSEKFLDVIAGSDSNGAYYIQFGEARLDLARDHAFVLMRVMKSKSQGVDFTEMLKEMQRHTDIRTGTRLYEIIKELNDSVLDLMGREIKSVEAGLKIRRLVIKEPRRPEADSEEPGFESQEEIFDAMRMYAAGGEYDERLSNELDSIPDKDVTKLVREMKRSGADPARITSLFDICEPARKRLVRKLL